MNKVILTTILGLSLLVLPAGASEVTGNLTTGLGNNIQGVVLTAPNTTAAKTDDREITILWTAVNGVDGYRLYRIKDAASAQLVDTLTVLTYADQDLADGLYSYQVQPFVGDLSPALDGILPTAPIRIETEPTPTPSGGGGGGGGGGSPPLTPNGDTNNDGSVNILDFNVLMINWGNTNQWNAADFNGDNHVDILDFNLLMINWSS